ncbi:rCG41836 [Rattus norvegicus]|uniref:RCG41836 n=1 Tax=Rattus norvegicus TaxID=10116 RepID=A6KUS8_RAT|nr:rCG41836 [Rattus norvegicus]
MHCSFSWSCAKTRATCLFLIVGAVPKCGLLLLEAPQEEDHLPQTFLEVRARAMDFPQSSEDSLSAMAQSLLGQRGTRASPQSKIPVLSDR